MTTKNVNLTSTEYTELSTVDCFVSNESSYLVKAFFADAEPAVGVEGSFTLRPEQGFLRATFPTGTLWGKCLEEGVVAKVSVNE